jgi:hypothetical protein
VATRLRYSLLPYLWAFLQAPNEPENFKAVLAGTLRGIYCLHVFNMHSNLEIYRQEGSARLAFVSQRSINFHYESLPCTQRFRSFSQLLPFHTFLRFSSLLLRKALLIHRRIHAVTLEGIDTELDRFSGASPTLF